MNDLYNADSPDLISIKQHSLQVIPPPHQVSNRIKFRIDQYGKLMLLFIKGFDEYIKLTIQFLFIISCLTTYSLRSIQRSKKKLRQRTGHIHHIIIKMLSLQRVSLLLNYICLHVGY